MIQKNKIIIKEETEKKKKKNLWVVLSGSERLHPT